MPKCPRCVQPIHAGPEACPHCGFELSQLDEILGSSEVRMKRVNDVAGLMRRRLRDKAEKHLLRFEKQFPQLFFAVHFAALSEMTSLRQYAFWLLNRASIADLDEKRPNENGILMVVDVNSKSATITYGYHLDAFLREEDLFQVLSRAHGYLAEGDYVRGIKVASKQLAAVLRKRAAKANRDPEAFAPAKSLAHQELPRLRQRRKDGSGMVTSEEEQVETEESQG